MMVVCETIQDMANFLNNARRGNPYSKTYNLGWRDHPNFSFKNNFPQFIANITLATPLGF